MRFYNYETIGIDLWLRIRALNLLRIAFANGDALFDLADQALRAWLPNERFPL